MSYLVDFYSVTKRPNSTYKPPVSAQHIQFNCRLMDGSGMLNPTLILDFRNSGEPQSYNYAFIHEWNRYYYIKDWRYKLGLWECDLDVDALASWKNEIGATRTYIFRANRGNALSEYIDNNYPYTTYHETINAYTASNPFVTNIVDGTYIIGITGQGGGIGGVTYIAMNNSQFSAFSQALFSNTNWLNVSDISNNLQKALINPIQYIQSIQWFPYTYSSIPGTAKSSLNFAWWTFSSINHKELNPSSGGTWIAGTFSIIPPRHPAQSTYGQEMLLPPATRYTAIVLPFGQWDIDPIDIVSASRVDFSYIVDLITGQAFMLVGSYEYDGDTWASRWFDSRQGKIGVPIAINQSTQDILGTASSVVAGGAAIASGGATAVLGAIGAVTSAAERIAPKSSTNGGQGNTAFYNIKPRIIGEFLIPAPRNYSEFGTPVFDTREINTIAGFVQAKAAFQSPGGCTKTETDDINGFFETGFFYE